MNDTHSGLNPTEVSRIVEPQTVEEIVRLVRQHRSQARSLSTAGGRHAMGGQQFLGGATLIDTRHLNRMRGLDTDQGLLTVEAGMQWPDVIRAYLTRPGGKSSPWGIRQKQTGADRLTIGGAVAANIHGRGLSSPPFVGDIESLEVVTSAADVLLCSRKNHGELFRHIVGGYGLFGIVTAVTLRLACAFRFSEWSSSSRSTP